MNAKQQKLVKEIVKHVDKIRAYKAAYGNSKNDNTANGKKQVKQAI